jgi:dinuclear metal center YbgI/SA1388 family protein
VAVASPHTAFDSTAGGINDGLCRRLGLTEVVPIRPISPPLSCKIVVFIPPADHDAVLSAAFAAGAGRIGGYSECSFAMAGKGTFFGSESTNPALGQRGRRETVDELRLELICPGDRLGPALGAIRAAHSYEEPAIDIYPLSPEPARQESGAGRIGRLPESHSLEEFARFTSQVLGHVPVQMVGQPHKQVQRVAVACGAGDDFLSDAAERGAEVLVTGEARFHRALQAEALDLGLILAGHHATERPGVEELAERIALAFPDLAVWPSQREADPLRLILGDTTAPNQARRNS